MGGRKGCDRGCALGIVVRLGKWLGPAIRLYAFGGPDPCLRGCLQARVLRQRHAAREFGVLVEVFGFIDRSFSVAWACDRCVERF